jgi:putative intracellular protease/amidase
MSHRILIIVTSHARLGATDKPTGFWAEELATPYYVLTDAGAQVVLASPAGGAAPLDPASVQPPGKNGSTVERMLTDAALTQQLQSTARVADLDGAAFDAVFFPGGHGTMWDLPFAEGVTRAVERAYANGRVIASVCHGAAGLVSARRPDGKPLVEGRQVNSFTNAEEAAVGLTEAVPFLLESRLRQLGGQFVAAANFQPFVAHDGQLVTGQNPQSSEGVAREVLRALRKH